MVISAFANPIDFDRVEYYKEIMIRNGLQNDLEPISGFPIIIDESDLNGVFMNGEDIKKEDIGKYAWKLTDGHHRVLSAIETNLPYLKTELEYAYLGNSTDY